MSGLWHWLMTVTGITDEAGKWYAFWSGFGANFGEVTLLAGVLAAWHRVNCHTKGCWRIGRQQVAGTTLVVCRRHHPDGKPTHENILELHRANLEAERIRSGRVLSDNGGSRQAEQPPPQANGGTNDL